jgi:hypothetical protein
MTMQRRRFFVTPAAGQANAPALLDKKGKQVAGAGWCSAWAKKAG